MTAAVMITATPTTAPITPPAIAPAEEEASVGDLSGKKNSNVIVFSVPSLFVCMLNVLSLCSYCSSTRGVTMPSV